MTEELVTVRVRMRDVAGRWSSACRVVAKILKCSKIYFQGATTCHDEIVKCNMRWVSCISWTVRNLCVTDGTTWHDKAQTMRHLAVTYFVPLKRHDLACHIVGNKNSLQHRRPRRREEKCQCEACLRRTKLLNIIYAIHFATFFIKYENYTTMKTSKLCLAKQTSP